MNKEMNIYFLNLLMCQFAFSNAWLFSQPTFNFINYSNKLPDRLSGFMTSFGDFNADRKVDIFVIAKSNSIQHIDVILMPRDDSKFTPKRIPLINDTRGHIRNVFTGDFNGDSFLDVVTCISENIQGPYSVEIAYGRRTNVESPVAIHQDRMFMAQPLHLDWDADMIGDIFGQLSNPQPEFAVFIGNANKTFTLKVLNRLTVKLAPVIDKLLFSYFVDLNQDGQADILLIGKRGKKIVLASVMKTSGDFQFAKNESISGNVVMIGQPVIGDFLFNGGQQMIFQYCGDSSCLDSRIMGCDLLRLSCRPANFSMDFAGSKLGFQVSSAANAKLSLAAPDIVPMSCGDLKMSGYIGCLVTMSAIDNAANVTLLRLHNHGGFMFSLTALEGPPKMFANVSQAAIFDLLEDGIPDIIVARQQDETGIMVPLVQETSGDNYFLKVMVLNGLCPSSDSCPQNTLPFGIPLPGIIVNYSTEGVSGNHQSSMVSLVSTSSFTPLNLPYAFFGLSTFSNYIERLEIQLPSHLVQRKHTLTFIVPKTQIVIIPFPLDDPSKWTNKLYIEPFGDKKVIYVAAALLGTMVFVAIILCILQYLEIREDRLEKMEEAQKFNFDAM